MAQYENFSGAETEYKTDELLINSNDATFEKGKSTQKEDLKNPTKDSLNKRWECDLFIKDSIFIKKNNQLIKVKYDEILFIQSDGNYCIILTSKKKIILKMSLVKIKSKLKGNSFFRISKSHILNLNFTSKIDLSSNKVYFEDAHFNIGRSYRSDFLQKLKILT